MIFQQMPDHQLAVGPFGKARPFLRPARPSKPPASRQTHACRPTMHDTPCRGAAAPGLRSPTASTVGSSSTDSKSAVALAAGYSLPWRAKTSGLPSQITPTSHPSVPAKLSQTRSLPQCPSPTTAIRARAVWRAVWRADRRADCSRLLLIQTSLFAQTASSLGRPSFRIGLCYLDCQSPSASSNRNRTPHL